MIFSAVIYGHESFLPEKKIKEETLVSLNYDAGRESLRTLRITRRISCLKIPDEVKPESLAALTRNVELK